MARPFLKRWLGFAVKAAVTAGLIWLLMRGFDTGEALHRLGQLSPWLAPAVLALLGAVSVLAAWRWTILMRLFGPSLRFRTTLRLIFEGQFFNQTLPSTIGGDGVRMYRAARLGIPAGAAINGVILDRVVGLGSLLLMVAMAQPMLADRVRDSAMRLGFAAVLLAGGLGIAGLLCFGWMPSFVLRWRLGAWVANLSAAARRMVATPAVILPVVAISLTIHALVVVTVWLIGRGLALPLGFIDCLVFVPAILLLSAVPISIAGWGVREGMMVTAFGMVGVSQSGSLTLSILFGFAMVAIGLPGGALWLASPDRHTRPADMDHAPVE
ncbi:MAG: lysylphosphatidylglycerol synthase transmembrane domain-containing protein [Alphaproteobacteria bacterium]